MMTPRSFFSEPRMDWYSVMTFADFLQLVRDFVDGELGQAVQLQFEDGVGLLRGERLLGIELGRAAGGVDVDLLAAEVGDQVFAGVGAIRAAADDRDHVIEVIERGQVAFEDVLAVLRLGSRYAVRRRTTSTRWSMKY